MHKHSKNHANYLIESALHRLDQCVARSRADSNAQFAAQTSQQVPPDCAPAVGWHGRSIVHARATHQTHGIPPHGLQTKCGCKSRWSRFQAVGGETSINQGRKDALIKRLIIDEHRQWGLNCLAHDIPFRVMKDREVMAAFGFGFQSGATALFNKQVARRCKAAPRINADAL